jgi:hypothetical protein
MIETLTKEGIKEKMAQVLSECWDAIEERYFESLWQSMPGRIAAVIAAEGWHTKY